MVPSLFVMNARGASLQGQTLTLAGISPTSIVFADRPVRAAGHLPTEALLEEWTTGDFARDAPNATVSVLSKDGLSAHDVVVELRRPHLEGDRLTFDVRVLEGDLAAADGPAAVFIDIIGLPFTPLSFAGVARRAARRAYWYGVASAPYLEGLVMPDFDAIIIGTGQAGPSLAFRLAGAGMKEAVAERHLVGGTCVNTGCTPTKALAASAHVARIAKVSSGALDGYVLPAWGAIVRRMFGGVALPPDVLAVYTRQITEPGAATAMLNWYRAIRLRSSRRLNLAQVIEVPTLVVWGEQDVALDPICLDGSERYVRDLTLKRLPGVTHWVQQDAPQVVNELLQEFLA